MLFEVAPLLPMYSTKVRAQAAARRVPSRIVLSMPANVRSQITHAIISFSTSWRAGYASRTVPVETRLLPSNLPGTWLSPFRSFGRSQRPRSSEWYGFSRVSDVFRRETDILNRCVGCEL